MKGLSVLLEVMTVVLYSCGVFAQLEWDTPREASKTDSVLEDVAGGSTIYTLHVINADGTVTYSIKSQAPPTPAFTVVDTELKLPAVGVDAETDSQTFVFVFTASDSPFYTVDSVEFTVTVIDVDEYPPVFNPTTYSGTVDDGAPAGTTILTVTASDADVNSVSLQYVFAGGNAQNTFSIDSNGVIVVSSTGIINRATTQSYSLTIIVSSNNIGAPAIVDIAVNGATSPPEFLDVPYSTSICRDVYKVTAVDIFDFTVQNSDAVPKEASFANSNTADCYTEGQSKSYSGNRQETRGGNQCDHWTTFDSVHEYVIDDNFPERSIVGASNYCRAPDGDNNPPWCFYNGGLGWGYCNVAVCIDVANFKMVFDSTSKNVISLQQELDVQAGSYVLVVTAIEGMETAAATITLNIWQPPVFNTPTDSDNTKICENTGPDEDIIQLTATSSIYTVTFSVVVSDLFEVVDGMLKTKSTINPSQFDIEPPTSAPREYSIKLKVVDSNGCDDEITFFIKIEDDNDNDPVFSQGTSLDIEVEAGTSPGEVLTKISATDADVDAPNNVLTYTLTGDGVEDFHFDSERFELSVAAELSYTKRAQYELTLTATDGGTPTRSAMISVNINIITRPVFVDVPENGIYEMTEALSPGDTVTVLTTSDLDAVARSETITVSIVTDNSNLFTIDNTNTPVSLKLKDNVYVSQYDLDETNSGTLSFPLTISVDDGNTDTTTDTTDIAIMVTDVNDIAPAFTQATYEAVIVDTISATTLVTTVTAVDGDVTQSFKNVMYSLSEDSTFEINSEGSIHVSSPSTVEYSSAGYTLTVKATDGLNHAVPAKVTITVQSGPVFVNVPVGGVYEMTEDKMPGATVTVLTTSDLDAVSRSETITVSIVTDTSNLFTVDNTDTSVSLKLKDDADMSQYNVDATDSGTLLFPLTISVDDGNTKTATDTIDITVMVTDVNDMAPAFTQDTYEAVIVDTISATTLVTTVTAVDGDVTQSFKNVMYSLSEDSTFEINSEGSIHVSSPSTVEYSSAGYTLTVKATDGLNHAVPAKVTITVQSGPVFVNVPVGGVYEMTEDKMPGATVTVLTTSDLDAVSRSETITVSIVTDTSNLFTVDNTDTSVSLKLKDDADMSQYNVDATDSGTLLFPLTISVDDGNTKTATDTIDITVMVTDVNDMAPAFTQDTYEAVIVDTISATSLVTTVTAVDGDVTASFNTVDYSLSGDSPFEIQSDGGIRVKTPSTVEYSSAGYTLTVIATDDLNSPVSAEVSITVKSAPVITNTLTAITIPEDKGRDMEVFDLEATDKDPPTSGLQFSIVSITPDDGALFYVEGSKVRTSNTLDLDAEKETSYNLIFRVSDGTYSSNSQPFTFTVTDVNDNSPEFAMTVFQASINENKFLGTAVIQTEATDDDVTATFNTIAYQIADGNEAGVFTIVESNGTIILETIPKLSMYTLTIKASDVDDSTKTATVQVKILVDASTVDECAVGPCKNGATCVPALNIYGCHCVDGWTGRECQTNIDDCILNPCSNNGLCSDLVDSFTCNCSEGWTGDTCTLECTGSTYGRNCEKLCGCVTSNLEDNTSDQFCNRTNGACNCNSKWQGHTCNEDVDECLSTTICDNKTNQACENYDGYYECVCQQGFSDNDQNICTKVPSVIVTVTNPITEEVVNITIELTVTSCPDLTVPSVYNETKHKLLQEIKLTLEDANDIIITNIRCGSIKFDMSVIVNKTQLPQLAVELQEIRDGKELTIGDEVVTASRIDISGSELPATATTEAKSVCEVYTLLNPCTGLNRCDVTSGGQPFCRIVKDNNLDIILGVGLGVGIPLLLIAIICVVVCYCLLRKRQLQEKERKSSADEFTGNGDYAAYSPPYQLPRLNGSSFKQGSSVTIYNGREQYQLAARNSLGYRNTHY